MKVIYTKTKRGHWCILANDDGSVFSIDGYAGEALGKNKDEAKQILQKQINNCLERTNRKYHAALKVVTKN